MGEIPRKHPPEWVIGPDQAGDRLDRAVAAWRGLSRAAVLRLIDVGGLYLNGRAVGRRDKGRLLHAGDALTVDPQLDKPEVPLADEQLPLEVLAEGKGWVAVNKPAGVPVRPHALNETGTVLNAVAARHPGVVGVGEGGLRSGVVHRLDNETSGVLIVAFEQDAWETLRDAFAEHRVAKRYLALVHGRPNETGQAVRHLRVARHAPAHVEVLDQPDPDRGTRRCSLAWRVLEQLGPAGCLVEVDLHTGFLHQVRAMMSALGHPVVGDEQYGPGLPVYGAPRQVLHAASITIEQTRIEAPLPGDFERVIEKMRQG